MGMFELAGKEGMKRSKRMSVTDADHDMADKQTGVV